jgi:hypothetical protein
MDTKNGNNLTLRHNTAHMNTNASRFIEDMRNNSITTAGFQRCVLGTEATMMENWFNA